MIFARLACWFGWHEYWSFADYISVSGDASELWVRWPHLQPSRDDSCETLIRKFREASRLRCRHCHYTYGGRP
jgi:hypothetical protein